MIQEAERSYRWGRFQGRFSLFLAVVQLLFLWRTFPVNLITAVVLLYVWTGLRHKRRYGFVLVYVLTGVAFLGGLAGLLEERWDMVGSIGLAFCFWAIPAAFYYPKRYREFGFGVKQQASEAKPEPEPEPQAKAAADVLGLAVADKPESVRLVDYEEWREAVAVARAKRLLEEKEREP
jgi:hypothetical protein